MKTLINLLGAYYHQDVWEDHNDHEEVWNEFIFDNKKILEQLKSELNSLLKEPSININKFIQLHSSGLSFEKDEDARDFLNDLHNYISK